MGIGASGFISVGNHDVTRGRIIITGGDVTAIGAGASPGIGGGVHENGTTVWMVVQPRI